MRHACTTKNGKAFQTLEEMDKRRWVRIGRDVAISRTKASALRRSHPHSVPAEALRLVELCICALYRGARVFVRLHLHDSG